MVWENQTESNKIKVLLLNHKSSFWFLVTFGKEVTNILQNLCLRFARQDGQEGKKEWKENYANKVTKKPKEENMGWTKQKLCLKTCTQRKVLYSECVAIILV